MGVNVSSLGPKAEISLLTCSPGREVWAHYGHTAIRVNDPDHHIDYTFNYGVFDFNTHNFLWKFVCGQTYYILGISPTQRFIESYHRENRSVYEQVLHLSDSEKEALWKALYTNSLPQNRSYLYNFFYDNCATRARIIIEEAIDGEVCYDSIPPYHTMRDVIKYYTLEHPWAWFGISLAVSSPSDQPAPYIDQLFAPELMMNAFDRASIVSKGDSSSLTISATEDFSVHQRRPLVEKTVLLTEASAPQSKTLRWTQIVTPMAVCWLLLLLTIGIEIREIRNYRRYALFDAIAFGVVGVVGILIGFLAFISIHPDVQNNYLLLWMHPIHFIFAIALCFRKFRASKIPYIYFKINLPLLLFAFAGIFFLPQYFHPALIPILLILLSRSIFGFSYLRFQAKKR